MSDEIERRIAKMIASPLFPLTVSGELKALSAPMEAELVRDGEGGKPCHACNRPDRSLWTNGRWQITSVMLSANPVMLFLETVDHIDFEHLDAAMASEFGVFTWRLEAAIRSVETVGRVHVHRWGDGSSHFHVWFQGRPARQLEYYGSGNVLWSQLVDPLPAEVIGANHRQVIDHFVAAITAGSTSQ